VARGVRGIDVTELFEDSRARFIRDARSGVVDDKGEDWPGLAATRAFDGNPHATGVGELHGIPGQIEQDLPQAAFVGEDGGGIGGDRPDDLQAFVVSARAQQFGDAAYEPLRIDGGQVELQLARFEPGVVEQVVDQPQQMFGRIPGRLRIRPLSTVQPGAGQKAQHADHTVQRRAHLVAHQSQEGVSATKVCYRARARCRACLRSPRHGRLRSHGECAKGVNGGLSAHQAGIAALPPPWRSKSP